MMGTFKISYSWRASIHFNLLAHTVTLLLYTLPRCSLFLSLSSSALWEKVAEISPQIPTRRSRNPLSPRSLAGEGTVSSLSLSLLSRIGPFFHEPCFLLSRVLVSCERYHPFCPFWAALNGSVPEEIEISDSLSSISLDIEVNVRVLI